MRFERSTDYAAIGALINDPRCSHGRTVYVGPREECEYIACKEGAVMVAVFLILDGIEIHFAFSPNVWGRTIEIAKKFIDWAWTNLDTPILVGPVDRHNRLALKLAKRAGFVEYSHDDGELTFMVLERPAA